MRQRVKWIDFAKGIAILLTIIGHTVLLDEGGNTIRGIIYSFHMPLFFILGMITFRCSANWDEYKLKLKKSFVHLITPALVTYFIYIIWYCYKDHSLITDKMFWRGRFYTLVFASGGSLNYCGYEVACMGIQWFFVALFMGRAIFDYVQLSLKDDSKLFLASIGFGLIGITMGTSYQLLPFSLDVSLAIMPLFFTGYYIKKYFDLEKKPFKYAIISFITWLCIFEFTYPDYRFWTYLELAVRRYPVFPLGYIGAIAGTVFVSEICIIICKYIKLPIFIDTFAYIGKYSLQLLCVHIFDDMFVEIWKVEGRQYISAVNRLIFDLVIFAIYMLIRYIVSIATKKMKGTSNA